MSDSPSRDDELVTVTARRPSIVRRPRVSLQVASGPDAGKRIDFDGRARVGTRRLADLVLTDPRVSGLHCEVFGGDQLRVRDLGSKNGTFLGGYRIIEAVVAAGDGIAVGDTVLRLTPIDELREVPLHESDDFFGLVGESPSIRALTSKLQRLATNEATVLIMGETGTGKERVAEALHLSGRRADGPLVIVDCGSMPATLVESELFGHERGAFTGAVSRVSGAFERAHGGTLFLDEVGELPLLLQPKLLRALESRSVRPVGSGRTINVDVRVIAATNRDLPMEVHRGRFREDLYYRLAVVSLVVPPLRERLEDIPLLAVRLLRDLGVDPASCLTVESLAALQSYDWPGNVRELRNTLQRSAALMEPLALDVRATGGASGRAEPTAVDLSEPLRAAKQRVIEAFERAYVTAMLDQCAGNVSECARRAGMDRMSIHRILQRLGLRSNEGERE